MVSDDSLKEAFEEAAEVASVVPESMQEAAFHRALDQILGHSASDQGTGSSGSGSRQRARSRSAPQPEGSDVDLAQKINRTEHPEISESMPVLERSLALLLIAKELGVDGLSPPAIADLLTEKFRIKTRREHVSTQLSAATKLVDRHKEGRAFVYRIMGAGEKHLGAFDSSTGQPPPKQKNKKSTRKRSSRSPSTSEKPQASNRGAPKRGTGSRPGPKAIVESLIQAEYFKTPRTIADIQDHLKMKVGHSYKTTDLSPALTRLLRDGQLDRDRDESGKYQYQQP